jgi:hypothetical protein
MQISALSANDLVERITDAGIHIRTGPFVFHLRTTVTQVIVGIRLLYADFPLVDSGGFADFHVRLVSTRGVRGWFRPQARFLFDGESPFASLPVKQALAMFEWCANWCVSNQANQYLVVHAAAVERDGHSAILTGPPGAGKSTLCAALVNRGWRLLTDELTLIAPQSAAIVALPRPIGLKGSSIQLIQEFAPGTVFGPHCHDTLKGTVAHMRPPTESVLRADEPALPRWLVFLRYKPDCATAVRPLPKAQSFMRLASSSFNYSVLGARGFKVLAKLMDNTDCYALEYSDLNEAIAWFDSLRPAEIPAPIKRAHA